jgi:phosphatidylglycerol:prolipoprotein diacylglycerol transferase
VFIRRPAGHTVCPGDREERGGAAANDAVMDSIPESYRWAAAMPLYLAGYLAAISAFRWMARRRGMETPGVRLVMYAGLIGGLLGATVAEWVAAGRPGKTIEGGIVGGFIAVVWMKRTIGLRRPTGDIFAVAVAAGEAVGRLGCFAGGCCFGKPTNLPWAVHDHGALRHPAQLYSSFAAALTLVLLVYLERKRILPENGLLWVQISIFCLARFAIEFVREGAVLPIGLTVAQIGCAAGLAIALYKLRPLVAWPRLATS